MQRHLTGVSGKVEGNYMYVAFSWANGHDHDPVVSITGLGMDQPLVVQEASTMYLRYNSEISGIGKYRIRFRSGHSVTLNFILPSNALPLGPGADPILKTDLVDEGLGFRIGAPSLTDPQNAVYALMPLKDPKGRFNFKGTWTQRLQGEAFMFSSSRLKKLFGGGTVDRIKEEQFIQMAAVFTDSQLTQDEVWDNVISGELPAVTAFVYSNNLSPRPAGNSRTFEVCFDPQSPSYYRTTGDDSVGNAIPTEYLNGILPARFISGGCPIPSRLGIQVIPTKRSSKDATDGSIFVYVTSSSVTPKIPRSIGQSAFDQDKYPSYTSLSSQDFEFRLLLSDGSTLTSGVITGSSYTFTGLSEIEFPYTVEVEEDATGEVATVHTGLFEDDNKISSRIPAGTQSESTLVLEKGCFCQQSGSINFQPMGGTGDPCGVCYTCDSNVLNKGGNVTGEQLMSGSIYQVPETITGTDGRVIFNGQLNQGLTPSLNIFVLNSNPTYDLYLFSTTGPGNPPVGAALQTETGLPLPDFEFTGLVSGWYMVRAIIDGYTCHSHFWIFVDGTELSTSCNHDVSIEIDPCTGSMTESVESNVVGEGGYVVSVNGVPVNTPFQVSPGDVVTIYARLPECADGDLNFVHTVTEADRQCTELVQGPVGCMDPTALNFDPSAQIDSGLCMYPDGHQPVQECPVRVENVTVSGNTGTVNFMSPESNYEVTWESPSTGSSTVIEDDPTSPELPDGAYVVTVTFYDGCQEIFVIGINVDPVYGCMDSVAENFLPSATIPYHYSYLTGDLPDGDPCIYRIPENPCIPKDLQKNLVWLDRCLEKALDMYYHRMRAGKLDKCVVKDLKTAVLLRQVLSRRGLECIYNCKDSATPDLDSVFTTCEEKWGKGGPSGDSLVFDPTMTYQKGDIVLHPDGNYYIHSTSYDLPQDPLEYHPENPWKLCTDPSVPVGKNVLDSYLGFLQRFCAECGIVSTVVSEKRADDPKDFSAYVEGESIKINGQTINFN
jgi:hypothetical protein